MPDKCSKASFIGLVALTTGIGPDAGAQTQSASALTSSSQIVRIWPGAAPGTEDWHGKEVEGESPGQNGLSIQYVTNVTIPTLTVIRPEPDKSNGTAVIICPGGGFQLLAIKHEGMDVAHWLATLGVTAFVLKYRVQMTSAFNAPAAARAMSTPDFNRNLDQFRQLMHHLDPARRIAVADGIQAIRYLRSNARHFGILPDRIGMIGFSAGAMTTMGVVMDSAPANRPNFAAPIYGAMEDRTPPADSPPLFIVATQDDALVPAIESTKIFSRWFYAGRPAELHTYEQGGHGFGASKVNAPVDGWELALQSWLASHGWLEGSPLKK